MAEQEQQQAGTAVESQAVLNHLAQQVADQAITIAMLRAALDAKQSG